MKLCLACKGKMKKYYSARINEDHPNYRRPKGIHSFKCTRKKCDFSYMPSSEIEKLEQKEAKP